MAQAKEVTLYANLMEEVKLRLGSIDLVSRGKTLLPYPLAKEYCWLQLRMICELIALACLIAHGDLREIKKSLSKEYAADKIISEMNKLHPEFFPKPIFIKTTKSDFHHLESVENNYLTKTDLQTLYARCGDKLHRGNVKKFLSAQKPGQPTNFDDVVIWANKIVDLLNCHYILSLDKNTSFLCTLAARAHGNNVHVALGKAVPEPDSLSKLEGGG